MRIEFPALFFIRTRLTAAFWRTDDGQREGEEQGAETPCAPVP